MLKKLGKCMLAALLSVCTVLTAAPAMQAVRAADEAVIIDDTEFEYSGNGDANAGGWESYGSGDPAVTEHWSNTAGATAQVTFNGTKLELTCTGDVPNPYPYTETLTVTYYPYTKEIIK